MARTMTSSIISSAAGMMPSAMMAETASEASSMEANEARSVSHRLGHVGEADDHRGDEPEGALRRPP